MTSAKLPLSLPEITLKGTVLSIILTILLGSANAFLGLKVGITISASIPAAVLSMVLLRLLFRKSNVLENNIVQTAASAGEALAAGIIFTLPALLITRYWQAFDYWESLAIAVTGGLLGVLFAVPLRRVLLADPSLRFPEGTAIGNVLKLSDSEDKTLGRYLTIGGAAGAVIALCQTGFKVIAESVQTWFAVGSTVMGVGIGFSPALIGAGFIIGPAIAGSILVGTLLCWFVAVPVIGVMGDFNGLEPHAAAITIWSGHVRYIGLGVLVIAGLWTLIGLFGPIINGIQTSLASTRAQGRQSSIALPRTEQDIPIIYVFFGILVLIVPIILVIYYFFQDQNLGLSSSLSLATIILCTVYTLIAGFIFSAICGYLVGLVGSSASPISAMALVAVLLFSLILYVLLGSSLIAHASYASAAAAISIVVASLIACAASIANDTMQDLKAGHIVGATPWKQEIMLFLGVIVAALVIPPVLQLLFDAYGIADVLPRSGMDPEQALAAPQAQLIAAMTSAVFTHNVPWPLLGTGALLAIGFILLNRFLQHKGFNLSILSVGLGLYLPLQSTTSLILGGGIATAVHYTIKRWRNSGQAIDQERADKANNRGLLLASGLVAGAALMGVVLAVPFALQQSTDALRIMPLEWENIASTLGLLVAVAVCVGMYRAVCKK